MKKIMITIGAVAIAAVVQAGTFNWGTGMAQYIYAAGGASKLGDTYTAYLFDANTYAQATAVADLSVSGIDFAKKMDSTSITSAGAISSKSVAVTADVNYAMYILVVDGDNVYIGPEKVYAGPGEGKSSTVQFSTTTSSKLAVQTTAYNGAGWYAAPEPTSGLLLLLGVAGLALKRKRA